VFGFEWNFFIIQLRISIYILGVRASDFPLKKEGNVCSSTG
jgi:hypothetical protein